MVTRVVLFSRILPFVLSLDNIMESERKCTSDYEAKKSCKIMTLDEKIKIVDELRGGMSTAAVSLTFR
jgi:hypothetical protein